jgi:hypothetical protein
MLQYVFLNACESWSFSETRYEMWCNNVILCERKWALYGIKCILRIFWQTWLHIVMNKKKSTLCKHVPCNTLTHSTNEDLLNIKRKGDLEVSYPLSYVFFYLLNLFWHTNNNFCFYAEFNFWDFVRNDNLIEWD